MTAIRRRATPNAWLRAIVAVFCLARPLPGFGAMRQGRKAMGMALVVAILLMASAAPAAAQTLTPQEKNRRAFFTAHVERQALKAYLSGVGSSRESFSRESLALSMRLLARAYRAQPGLDPARAATFVNVVYSANSCTAPCYAESSPAAIIARAEQAFRDPATIPPDQRADSPFFLNVLADTAHSLSDGQAALTLSAAQRMKDPIGAPELNTAVGEALDCAANTRCAQAFDAAFGPGGQDILEGVSIRATPSQLNATPVVQGEQITVRFEHSTGGPGATAVVTLPELKLSLDAAGNLQSAQGPVGEARLEQEITAEFEDLNEVSLIAQDEFVEQSDDQLQTPQLIDATPPSEAERQQILEGVAQREALIQNAQATLNLFGDVISQFDPNLGKQVKITTNSVAQIASGVNGAIAGIINLGAQVATGNVFGAINTSLQLIQSISSAALGLNDLFYGTTRDAPEDPVSTQLTALSSQMSALETKLDKRFDRIESGLDVIYGEVVGGFEAMDARFDQVDAGISDIQASLLTQRFKLDQFERNMRELTRTTEERRLWERIKSGLGYRDRFRTVMEPGDFNSHIQVFYAHAGVGGFAFDGIALGPDTGPTADEDLLQRLSAPFEVPDARGTQLEENVNYLDWLIEGRFQTSVFGQRLPNFRDWALPARAYARMLIEQPERAPTRDALGSNPDLREIVTVGRTIRDNLAALARNKTAYTKVLDNHSARTADLLQTLHAVEGGFLTERALSREILYGGPLRRPTSGTAANLPLCGPEADPARSLSTPTNITAEAMLPAQFLVADAVRRGDAEMCWEAYWSDNVHSGSGLGATDEAKLNVEIRSRWRATGGSWQDVRVAHYKTADRALRCWAEGRWDEYDYICVDAEDAAEARWESSLKSSFQSGATVGALNDALSGGCDGAGSCTGVADTARSGLDAAQVDLRVRLVTAIADGGSANLAARRVNGAKALVQSLATLGLPVALQRDELLRSLLRGDQAVLDSELADREIRSLAAADFRAQQRDRDPLARLETWQGARLAELRGQIAGWQDRVIAGTHDETHRLIESTLEELELARITAYARSSAQGTNGSETGTDGTAGTGQTGSTDSSAATGGGAGALAGELTLGGGTGTPPDTAPPTASLRIPRAGTSTVASRGLTVFVTLDEPGSVSSELLMDARQAKRLGIAAAKQVVVGRGKANVPSAGKVKVVVKLTKRAKSKLRRAKSAKLTLRTTVADRSGNRRTVTKRIVLKR